MDQYIHNNICSRTQYTTKVPADIKTQVHIKNVNICLQVFRTTIYIKLTKERHIESQSGHKKRTNKQRKLRSIYYLYL